MEQFIVETFEDPKACPTSGAIASEKRNHLKDNQTLSL